MANLLSTTTIGSSQVLSVANMAEHGVITTSNIGNQSVSYAGSAGSVNGNMQGTFVGDISWNGGVNINVSGESSFDLFTNGQWGVWESQTASWWIRANWGDHLRLVENGKNVYVYGSRLYNDSGQQAVFNNGGTWGISISGNASTASTASNSNALGGIGVSGFLRDDGWNSYPGQDANTQEVMRVDFTYSNNAPYTGELIRFGSSGYSTQFNTSYGSSDNFSFRTRNGDIGSWNDWRTIIHSGNIGSQSVSYASSAGNADTVDGYHANNAAGGIAVINANGYWYPPSWINVGGAGIYSGTNNAHLLPNGTSPHGAWEMIGSRGGWSGIYFRDSGNTIMANANDSGFYNANAGWQIEWYNGTLYCSKSANGGGTMATVIDSTTIGSQSVSYASSAGNADTLDGLNSSVFVRNDVYNSADAGLQVFRNIGTNTGSWQSDNHTFGLENSDAGYLTINFHRAGYTSNNILYTGSKFNFDTVVESSSDFRAPIFYDSENTGYYLDPASRSNLNMLTLSGAGHFFPNYWIELSGYFGLYSPYNSAHFYPNNASYGSWRCSGSRNGWGGIEFDASNGQVVLMINPSSNTTGFHNNSYGWQFYWESGTLYCYKNSYGGGTQATVLDTSNFTNWAQDKNTAITTSNIGDQSVAYANSAGYVPGMIKGDEWYGSTYIGSGSIYSPIFYDANDSYWVIDPSGYSRYNTADVNRVHNYGWYTNSQWGDSAMLCIGGDFDPAYPIQIETERWGASLYTNKGSLWATDFINSSDISYKTNIVDITSGLSVIESLQPVTYTRIDDSSQKLKAGLIAQEVQDSLPHIVSSTIEPGTLDEVLGVDYVQVIPYLISAIKEQQQQIADLTTRIAQLEQ